MYISEYWDCKTIRVGRYVLILGLITHTKLKTVYKGKYGIIYAT